MCIELGFCIFMKSKKVDVKFVISVLFLKNYLKTILVLVFVVVKFLVIVIKFKFFKVIVECILCEFIMKEFDGILKENVIKVLKYVVIM